jgi:hypothetical protein
LQQHSHAQPVDQFGLRALFQHLEARRHVGLERKLVQQPRAERMDGLHLQPARRVERLCEQAPRMHAPRWVGQIAFDPRDGLVQPGIVERGPFGQRVEHAVRHVGSGGLGIGQAQDLFRLRAAQQQADHALRQHVGLARARIGRDPGGRGRVGRRALHVEHAGRDMRCHSSSSGPADHSLTRAR